jgi:predicted SPOUT superfamily RNA methylase MTH1
LLQAGQIHRATACFAVGTILIFSKEQVCVE